MRNVARPDGRHSCRLKRFKNWPPPPPFDVQGFKPCQGNVGQENLRPQLIIPIVLIRSGFQLGRWVLEVGCWMSNVGFAVPDWWLPRGILPKKSTYGLELREAPGFIDAFAGA